MLVLRTLLLFHLLTLISEGREKVMTGDLPDGFLRFNVQPVQAPGMVPVMYPPNAFMPMQAAPCGRLSITVVQAKLAKNYGLTRMDPYCRITIGNHVFETPTDSNGAANPRWNKLLTCPLPKGVATLYVEIFDEEVPAIQQQPMFYQQPMPVMMVPQAMVPGVPVAYPPQQYPQGGRPPTQPQPQLPIQPSQQDIQNLKDMFPNMEESVITSVLEASGNNVESATTYLLTMTNEDQENIPANAS
ncbi:hypothetical protein QZH41_020400 [Actinostola sp. cb2023]|nr:hypothetical protein QZH41_020400 [Actinostola sp. cb2023]